MKSRHLDPHERHACRPTTSRLPCERLADWRIELKGGHVQYLCEGHRLDLFMLGNTEEPEQAACIQCGEYSAVGEGCPHCGYGLDEPDAYLAGGLEPHAAAAIAREQAVSDTAREVAEVLSGLAPEPERWLRNLVEELQDRPQETPKRVLFAVACLLDSMLDAPEDLRTWATKTLDA